MTDRQRVRQKIRGWMFRHVPLMITCAEFDRFILDYLEGQLPERQRRVFKLHLTACRDCRSYLAAYQRTVALGKAAFAHPESPVPNEVPEDLVRAILAAREAEN